jgi:hypothetical protein
MICKLLMYSLLVDNVILEVLNTTLVGMKCHTKQRNARNTMA